jgi:hypothetical protein
MWRVMLAAIWPWGALGCLALTVGWGVGWD